MATEVECKMSLGADSVQLIHQRIDGYFPPESVREEVQKKDLYWGIDPEEKALFRVRESGDRFIMTRKSKETRSDGLEVNDEIEFSSGSDEREIHRFFSSLGYLPLYRKEKHGWLWANGSLTVELVEVSTLGWYVEMEILVDARGPYTSDDALRELMELRSTLELDELPLEGRYYSEMLQEQRKGV